MNNNQSFTPKLISDIPVHEDKFGTHKKIAESIHRLIVNNDGGKTISIQGQWGSGKSTVIKILSTIFESDNESLIINYDAWIHSGDPLRRAFFNTVIESVQRKTWLNFPQDSEVEPIKRLKNIHEQVVSKFPTDSDRYKEFWTLFKDSLFGKVKHVIKRTTPMVDEGSKTTIALLLYFPIAALMAVNMFRGYTMDDYFFMEWPTGIHVLFWLCVLITVLPLLKLFGKSFNSKSLSIFLSKTITDEQTDQVEEPDLTSIEFKELFSFVMKIALTPKSTRRVVIVIDNLDRLKNDDDEQVWSMLKSFIDHSSFDSEVDDWINRLWVIIPRADNHKQEADFFEKIFQLKFILPPPVSINWHLYLKELLVNSFSDISSDEAEKIKDIFDWHVINGNTQTPTPRNIKTFINDLVWLVTLWEQAFSKVVLASYLLDTKKLEIDFVNDLTNKKIPSRLALNLLGKQLDDAYASIYFNVEDSRQAKSFIYVPKFEDLLREGNSKEICSLIKLNPHSAAYLGAALRRLLPNACKLTPWLYFNSVIAMEAVKNDFDDLFKIHLNTSLEIALAELEDLSGLPLVEKNANSGLLALLNMHDMRSEDVKSKVIDAIKNSSTSDSAPLSFRPDINTIIEWCQRFNALIKDYDLGERFKEFDEYSIPLPLGAAEWRIFVDYNQSQFDFYKVFKPYESHSQIVAYIDTLNFDEYKKNMLIWAYKLNLDQHYQGALDNVYSEALSGGLSDDQLEKVFELILEGKEFQPVFDFADNLHSNEIFFVDYGSKSIVRSNEYLGKLILCILLVDPGLEIELGSDANAINGKAFISQFIKDPDQRTELHKTIAQLVQDYGLERFIIDYSLKVKNYSKFASYIVNQHSEKDSIYAQFDIDTLDSELQKFVSVINEKPYDANFRYQAINYLVQNENLIDVIKKSRIRTNGFYYYAPLLETYWDEASDLVSKFEEYFLGLSQAGWKLNIASYTSATRALAKLPSLKIGKNLEGALKSILFDAANHDTNAFEIVYNHLSQRSKNRLASYTLSHICESKKTYTDKFWLSLETVLLKNLVNLKKNVPTLMESLIANRDWTGLDRLSNYITEKSLIDVYSSEVNLIRNKLTAVAKLEGAKEKKIIAKVKQAIKRDAKELIKARKKRVRVSKPMR